MNNEEKVIGTFLYAASSKSYIVYNLIFTDRRILAASLSWKKNNIIIDTIMAFSQTPFFGTNFQTLSLVRWNAIKEENTAKSIVSYDPMQAEQVMKLGLFTMIIKEIMITPYSMVKNIQMTDYPLTKDITLRFIAAPLASSKFLIPAYSFESFKDLIKKTPLANKLNEN